MTTPNIEMEAMYKAASEYSSLKARLYTKVLVGSTDDARTAVFYIRGNISYNRPSWGKIEIDIDNGKKIFDLATKTMGGRRAYFLPWNDSTEYLFYVQIEREKLLKWLETAVSEEFVCIGELILVHNRSGHTIIKLPGFQQLNLQIIRIEILKLDLLTLKDLNGLVGAANAVEQVMPAMAA